MNAPTLLGLGAFGFALVLTPLIRDAVRALGWFDQPDQGRKLHRHPVPRVGGVPILLACALAFAILARWKGAEGDAFARVTPFAWRIAPAVLIIFLAGLVDDLAGLRPWQKLASQFAAGAMVCWGGVSLSAIAGVALPAWIAIPLTLVWLAGCANAFNLIDGIDGLAGGVALIASLAVMAASVVLHHAGLALVSAALAGALLGFLRYNFRSASIFLGDCGSLTLGFLLGCCAIVWSNESASFGGAVAPLLAVSVPLADTALAVIRRVLRRRPVFSADREHIHHRLLARGFPARRVVLVLWGAGALAAVFALAECVTPYPASAILLALYCAGAAISVRHLGYDELRAAGRVVEPGRLLRAAHAELQLRALETALAAAQSVDQRWEAIRRACRELGFVRASMRAGGEVREAWLQDAGPCAVSWTLRVPLAAGEWINVGDGVDLAVEPSAVAPLADLLYRAIAPRLAAAPGAPVIAAAAVVAGTR